MSAKLRTDREVWRIRVQKSEASEERDAIIWRKGVGGLSPGDGGGEKLLPCAHKVVAVCTQLEAGANRTCRYSCKLF